MPKIRLMAPKTGGEKVGAAGGWEAFQAWMQSPAFGHGHRSAAERAGGPAQPSVGISRELWSYEVAGGS